MTAFDETSWARLLLIDTGVPTTVNNEGNVMRWMTAEEPTDEWWDRNNPLNSSLDTSSTDGLGSYPTLDDAAAADAATLHQTNMAGVLAALKANDPTATFAAAVETSPWASSHYAGDPINKIPVPTGTVTAPASSGSPAATLDSSWSKILTNPLIDPAGAAIKAGTSGIESDVAKVAAKLAFVAAGVGLVVLGVFKTAAPNTSVVDVAKKAGDAAKDAGTAAVAA